MKVIIALDQTHCSEQILRAVACRSWQMDTTFKLLTVIERTLLKSEGSCESARKQKQVIEQRLEDGRKLLQSKIPNCTAHVDIRHGYPQDAIISAAVDWYADLLLLGAHGDSPNRLFPGALAKSLIQRGTCNVELVLLQDMAGTPKELISQA
jgi:nucleotide-binding universal stress UspA family protein